MHERSETGAADWEAVNQRSISCVDEFKAIATPLAAKFAADHADMFEGRPEALVRVGAVRVSTTAHSTEAGMVVARGDAEEDEMPDQAADAIDAAASAVALLVGTSASSQSSPLQQSRLWHRSGFKDPEIATSRRRVSRGSSRLHKTGGDAASEGAAAALPEVLLSSSRQAAKRASTGVMRSSSMGKQEADIVRQAASREAQSGSQSLKGGRDRSRNPSAYDRRRTSTRKTLRALRGRLSDVVALNASMSAGAASGRLVRAQTLSGADLLRAGPLSPDPPQEPALLRSHSELSPLSEARQEEEEEEEARAGAQSKSESSPHSSQAAGAVAAAAAALQGTGTIAQPANGSGPPVMRPCELEVPGLHPSAGDVNAVFDPSHERWTRGCFGKMLAQTPEEILLGHEGNDVVVTSNGQGRDGHAQLKVTCLWATHFHALRQLCLGSQRAFVESMAMSHSWSTSGGKSGSTFERSDDRRFVIKQVSRNEFQAFTRNSLAYFDHMREVMCGNIDMSEAVLVDGSSTGPRIIRRRRPSFLLRIVGAYEVSVSFTPSPRDAHGVLLARPPPKRSYQRNVFVMENLWFGTEVPNGLKFDLKGLARNMTSKKDDVQATITQAKQTESQRAQAAARAEGDTATAQALPADSVVSGQADSGAGAGQATADAHEKTKAGTVLLDSDFLSITEGQPVAVTETSMALLMDGLRGDTDFLCQSKCMDYSLLVGVSSATGRLIVGIIDYANTFTAAKRLENAFKSIIESEVTIQEPARYRARMLRKARSYFMPVPTRLAGPNIALQTRSPSPIDSVGAFWEPADASLEGEGDDFGWRRVSDPLRRLLAATEPRDVTSAGQLS